MRSSRGPAGIQTCRGRDKTRNVLAKSKLWLTAQSPNTSGLSVADSLSRSNANVVQPGTVIFLLNLIPLTISKLLLSSENYRLAITASLPSLRELVLGLSVRAPFVAASLWNIVLDSYFLHFIFPLSPQGFTASFVSRTNIFPSQRTPDLYIPLVRPHRTWTTVRLSLSLITTLDRPPRLWFIFFDKMF